jgi:hypothetical protein
MPTDLQIDLKKLRKDVATTTAKRPVGLAPNGQPLSGAMEAVRRVLPALEAMHETATWNAIAEGLTAQGITTRTGGALTGKRLTSLIASIRQQEARRLAREARKAARSDLAKQTAVKRGNANKTALAPELTKTARMETAATAVETEERIRRSNFERHSGLFRGNTK